MRAVLHYSLLTLVLVAGDSSAVAADQRAVQLLRDWRSAVLTHAPGNVDEAFAFVSRWTHADLERLRPYAEALAGFDYADRDARRRQTLVDAADRPAIREEQRAAGELGRFRELAVLLHTDVMTLSNRSAEVVTTPVARHLKLRWEREDAEPRVLVQTDDGQAGGYELASLHWELAMSLLDVVRAEEPRAPIVALWYRAVGAHMANGSRFGEATPLFARARRTVPEDPGVMFGEACFQETLGAPRVQEVVRTTVLANGLTIRDVSSPEVHLRRAEALLRRSLEARPAFADARVRLARVLTLQERPTEALDVLTPLGDVSTLTQRQQYLAHMFRGDAEQALGLGTEAVTSFQRAVQVFPTAQSARTALAYATRLAGDRSNAAEVLVPLLEVPLVDRGTDPWSDYYAGDAVYLDDLWQELRALPTERQ